MTMANVLVQGPICITQNDGTYLWFHTTKDLWDAAYRAGQEAMREKAAKFTEEYSDVIAEVIRALPLD